MKPAVIVCGCGRSGTNVMVEMLRGNPTFNATSEEEDKLAFQPYRKIPDGYLTKCDTVYFNPHKAEAQMHKYPHLHLIWMMRDPRDMIMSKMRRGVPEAEGGDCKRYASDSTVSGAIDDIQESIKLVAYLRPKFPNRVRIVRMEDVLTDPERIGKELCEWLGLKFYRGMTFFWKRMRNRHKARRYKGIDKSQIAMWKNWRLYEGGWFVQRQMDLDLVFPKVENIARYFDYEVPNGNRCPMEGVSQEAGDGEANELPESPDCEKVLGSEEL